MFRRLPCIALTFLLVSPAFAHVPDQTASASTANHINRSGLVDATELGEPIALNDGWRVHSGDNLAWANPSYDDSTWPTLAFGPGAADQMFEQAQGFVWIRIHIKLDSDHGPLSLLLNRAGSSYEVFANGQTVGHYGNFRSIYGFLLPTAQVVSLGGSAPGDQLVLALRLWAPQHRSLKVPEAQSIWIGTPATIDMLAISRRSPRTVFEFDDMVVALLGLLIGSGLIGLFLAQRGHREYAWAGISLILIGLYYTVGVIGALTALPLRPVETTYIALGYASIVASVEFLFCFIGQRPGKFVRVYQASLLACAALGLFAFYGLISVVALDVVSGIAVFSWAVLSAVLLIVWYLRGNREAAILLLPLVFFGLALPLDFLSQGAYSMGWTSSPTALIPDLHLGPVHFVFSSLAIILYMLSFVVILAFRFLRTSHEQERGAAELEAAHRVQSRLVPASVPSLGRFSLEAAYVAAAEVGGDFYQAFPEAGGGLLFFMGDVSGKGLSAAMIGMVMVGAVRTIAAQKVSPAASLTLLNRQLLGQTEGGFVTCLCARLSSDGSMVIANAGHLAPYLNGVEVNLANGFPLGIVADAEYEETTVMLPNPARLTFISDGIVEAKNGENELLGFARTQELSTLPATAIAEAAQKHGQADDITVVTIEC
jgi:phosphoserine phosphatase RsbU/P